VRRGWFIAAVAPGDISDGRIPAKKERPWRGFTAAPERIIYL
jgi:hypothetical protein